MKCMHYLKQDKGKHILVLKYHAFLTVRREAIRPVLTPAVRDQRTVRTGG